MIFKCKRNPMIAIGILCLIWITPFHAYNQEKEKIPGWPAFRGMNNTGTWHTELELDTLTPNNIRKLWEVHVNSGYAGPTVSGQKVYVMDFIRETSTERVLCFHASTGAKSWEHGYDREYARVGYPTGPRASVLVEDSLVYALGTMGDLHCLNAETGNVSWYKNTLEVYENRIPIWGLAASPIITGDNVIVQVGGVPDACIVAFNKFTGREVWKALGDNASYSTPILIEQGGKRVMVIWTGEHVAGISPGNGKVYWKIPYEKRKMIMNVASPVYSPPYLFLSSFFDGAFLYKLDQEKPGAELIWHRVGKSERATDALHTTISTPVIKDEYIYGVDSYGEVRCLELLTGERVWEDKTLVRQDRWSNIHFVRQGEMAWGFNETGSLILGKFTPEAFKNYGSVKLIDPVKISPNPRGGVCWAHPAFFGNRVIVRNDKKMVCYELRENE